MILNTAPQNEAVMSNVGEIGEFRIRNSAKAFNILSSGLYANKIRAIIRELSCNAVDSHAAAGKKDTPFDVHLPTALEPEFSIRDYGTGLTHEQVTQIYTTYFESTKTNSNEFIGALGLGSKSPFSYTDNFTVTAVRDGHKGIYSAFINDNGVPSIALMTSEASDEPAGVEVKFSVNDRNDFGKFQQEAQQVYTYFALRPVVSGPGNFRFRDVDYESKDIVPSVHSYKSNGYAANSVAIMGNIAYPIQIPNAESNLGDLAQLLNCGLEMHFGIGELDFQASREGLSYIPQTVEAIRQKLIQVRDALLVVLSKEADAITCQWTKAFWLNSKIETVLWTSAARKYCIDTKFSLLDVGVARYNRIKPFKRTVTELAAQFNVSLNGFSKHKNDLSAHTVKVDYDMVPDSASPNGYRREEHWKIAFADDVYFIENDTKVGVGERAKYHWKAEATNITTHRSVVYIASAADKTKPMQFAAFMQSLSNPPRQMKASGLKVKPLDNLRAKDVTILKLEKKDNGYYSRYSDTMVWRDSGKADTFDNKVTYYYLPLSGYTLVSTHGHADPKELIKQVNQAGLNIKVGTVYGVRKADLDWAKRQKNWVNLEDHIAAKLKAVDNQLVLGIALTMYKNRSARLETTTSLLSKLDANSPFLKAATKFKGVQAVEYSEGALRYIVNRYSKDTLDLVKMASDLCNEVVEAFKAYPMLQLVDICSSTEAIVADYIKLIDKELV